MEITFDREYLQTKVDLLKGITKHKSLMPICRTLLFDLPGKTISATDLEVSAVTRLIGNEDGDMKIVIPAGTLSETLGNLKNQEVRFACNNGDKVIKIEQGRIEIGLTLADPEEFPEISVLNDKEAFSLDGKDIIKGISKTLYAVSSDETRYVLTGMLMQVRGGQFRMCGTDGFRMALLKKDLGDVPDTPQIVIPGRNVKILKEIIDEKDTVGVIINSEKVQFMTPKVTVILRTLSGAYPDYENVLTNAGGNNIAFVKRIEFLDCLKRMAPIATKTDPVKLSRTFRGGLTVRIESEKGYAQETIDCEFKNDVSLDMEFNLKFLLDAIEHIESDQVVVRYPDKYGVVVIDSGDYLCGVMPLRTGWTPIEQQADSSHKNSDGGKDEQGT